VTARRTLANAGLAAGATVLTLLVAEQALRLLGIDYRPVRIYARDPDQRGLHLFDEKQFVYDPELIWRPRPGASVFNSQGFRGPELPAVKPPGESWLFAVGDSNTLGWDTEKGANWPADLQRLLAAAGARFRVVNAGVYGYSSYQGLARLREALAYRPDWVLVSFGGNDGHPVGIGDREFLSRGAFARQIERALLPFRVGRLALGGLRAVARREGRTVRVPPDEYGEHLATMIAEARAAGADIALLTRPYVGPLGVQGTWKHVAPRYRELTVEVGAAHGAPVVDLYSEFKGRDDLFADESHFTNEGHREAARIVLETLRPLLVPSSP
jgi:lysophospholipase L1-like esterase